VGNNLKKVYVDKVVYYNDNKQHHNENGPAVEYYDGGKEWWINGKQISKQEFILRTRQKKLNKILNKNETD
jgi:hypothetical protein